jgi:hypothetical protein
MTAVSNFLKSESSTWKDENMQEISDTGIWKMEQKHFCLFLADEIEKTKK